LLLKPAIYQNGSMHSMGLFLCAGENSRVSCVSIHIVSETSRPISG